MLYVFYKHFHPWTSESISVGFEPGWEKHKEMKDDVYNLEGNMDQGYNKGENEKFPSNAPIQPSFGHTHIPGIDFIVKVVILLIGI